jgi:hypothetical protein
MGHIKLIMDEKKIMCRTKKSLVANVVVVVARMVKGANSCKNN